LIFHPATQILTWVLLIATTQALGIIELISVSVLVLLCAYAICAKRFIQLLRRTRWIMLSLVLIYAYSTPGQTMWAVLGMFSPSYEGLTGGALQLARLLVVLGGLAVLLERLPKEQLISGLYTLFVPLQWCGISRERLAVRLALTLHYAELEMARPQTLQDISQRLSQSPDMSVMDSSIKLPVYSFHLADGVLLGFAMVILGLAML